MAAVPSSFQLLGRDFRVVRKPDPSNEEDGCLDTDTDTIIIYADGKHRIGHTFGHELMHAMFKAAGREDLSDDEALVDVMGGLLWQFMRTAR